MANPFDNVEPREHRDAPLMRDRHPPQAAAMIAVPRSAAVTVLIVVALVALSLAVVFLGRSCANAPEGRDPNASLGQLEGKSPEEIQTELDRVVEEGMFDISIASRIEFADGTSEGELRIENVPGNPYLMKVEILRNDTGERVYASGVIEPNHHIQKARLDSDLDAGDYPCTAVFYAYDMDDEQLLGQAAAQLTLSVQN